MTTGGALRFVVPVAGVVLLGALFLQLGPESILTLFGTIGLNFVTIVAIFVAHEVARAAALGRCLPPGDRLPLWRLTWLQCLSETVRTVTHAGPLVAEPARGWLLAKQGVQGAHAYAAAVSELIVNSSISALVTVVVLVVALLTMDLGPHLRLYAHVLIWTSAAFVLVVAASLISRTYVIGAILRGLPRLPVIGRRLRIDPADVRRMEDAMLRVLRDQPGTLALVIALELVAQAILIFDTYVIFRAMALPISVNATLLVEALTKMANLIQLIGATEGAYAVVFEWLGLAAAIGFTLSLVKRVRSLAIAALSLALLAGTTKWRSLHAL
jgi:Lysylphosphatidylglycerol synthase TM region